MTPSSNSDSLVFARDPSPGAMFALVGSVAVLAAGTYLIHPEGVTLAKNSYGFGNPFKTLSAMDWLPEYPAGHIALATAYAEAADTQTALSHFQAAITRDSNDGDAHCRYARFLDQIGRHADAIPEYQLAFRLSPDSLPVRNSMALLLLEQQRLDDAARMMDDADFADEESCITRGVIRERRQEPEQARRCYEEALAINPDSADAHRRLGVVLLNLGHGPEAIQELTACLRRNPGEANALLNLGLAYAFTNQLPEALGCYQRALRQNPANALVHYNLAHCLALTGEWSQALEHFHYAAQLGLADIRVQIEIAHAQFQAGDKAVAAAKYQAASASNPEWQSAVNSAAWSFATDPDQGHRQGAAALYYAQILCEATGFRHPDYLETLAAAFSELGRFDEARRFQMDAMSAAPTSPGRNREMAERLRQYQHNQVYRTQAKGK